MNAPIRQPESDEPATRFAKDQLKSIIERVERLKTEQKELSDAVKDIYAEARGNGYNVKALQAIVKMRAQDADELSEFESIVDLYKTAMGML